MENTSHIGQLSSIYKVCAGYIDLFTCTLHSLYLYLSVFSGKSRFFLRQFHFRYSLFVARFGDTTRFYTFLVNSTCRHISNREATTFAFSSVLRCKNGIKKFGNRIHSLWKIPNETRWEFIKQKKKQIGLCFIGVHKLDTLLNSRKFVS